MFLHCKTGGIKQHLQVKNTIITTLNSMIKEWWTFKFIFLQVWERTVSFAKPTIHSFYVTSTGKKKISKKKPIFNFFIA
ncbi:hypothetical protein Mgra_00001220, partial [Meloidogyne graminicola]